jgi:hypothetical protein
MTILSNWDTCTVDLQSRSTNGITEPSACSVQVEVHHNWLNVLDRASWRPGSGLPDPVIATVRHGELTYRDTSIVAIPCHRQGVFFAAWFIDGSETHGMAGMSCLGHVDGRYVGITTGDLRLLRKQVRGWVKDQTVSAAFASLSFTSALRFCQGDSYIANGAGFPVPATIPGEALTPLVYLPRENQCNSPSTEKN